MAEDKTGSYQKVCTHLLEDNPHLPPPRGGRWGCVFWQTSRLMTELSPAPTVVGVGVNLTHSQRITHNPICLRAPTPSFRGFTLSCCPLSIFTHALHHGQGHLNHIYTQTSKPWGYDGYSLSSSVCRSLSVNVGV